MDYNNQQQPQGIYSKPRINGSMIPKYVGREVILIGKCLDLQNNVVTMEAPDNVQVQVYQQPGSEYTEVVEVVGIVNDDGTIKETSFVPVGSDFNMENYNQLVQLANGPFRELFTDL